RCIRNEPRLQLYRVPLAAPLLVLGHLAPQCFDLIALHRQPPLQADDRGTRSRARQDGARRALTLYTTIPGCTRFVGHVVGYDVQRTRRLPTTAYETSGSPPDSCCEDSITRYAFDGTTYREVIARPTRQRQLDDASRVPFPTTARGPRPRPATPEASKSRTIVRHLTRRSPPDTFCCEVG